MKVLPDEFVGVGPMAELASAGQDVSIVSPTPPFHALTDEQVLERAYREGRALVTLDKDFGELAVLRCLPHVGIVRIVGYRVGQQGRVCVRILERSGQELASGALVTAEPGRVRILMGE